MAVARSFCYIYFPQMVLVVRTDLAMTKGKVATQCAHAAVACYKKGLVKTPDFVKNWERFGQVRVCSLIRLHNLGSEGTVP